MKLAPSCICLATSTDRNHRGRRRLAKSLMELGQAMEQSSKPQYHQDPVKSLEAQRPDLVYSPCFHDSQPRVDVAAQTKDAQFAKLFSNSSPHIATEKPFSNSASTSFRLSSLQMHCPAAKAFTKVLSACSKMAMSCAK